MFKPVNREKSSLLSLLLALLMGGGGAEEGGSGSGEGEEQVPKQTSYYNPGQNLDIGNMSLLDMLSSYRPYSQWRGFFK